MGIPCPACGAPGAPGASSCEQCGLDLAGADAAELRRLNGRLAEIEHERWDVWERRRVLAERVSRSWAPPAPGAPWSPPPRPPAPPVRPAARAEWSVDRVRTLLLWVGAALLAASALAFTTVAWAHLGNGGRALLLAGVTGLCVAGAVGLRTRLPATAETASALAIALCLIDWQALRHAGLTRAMSGSASWTIGLFAVSIVALALGEVVGRQVSRVAVALLLPLALELVVATAAGAVWSGGIGLALVASAAAVAATRLRERDDRIARAFLALHAAIAWWLAAILAMVAVAVAHSFLAELAPAFVVLTLGLAPRAAMARATGRTFALLATVVCGAVVAAPIVALSATFGPEGFLAWLVVVGGTAFALSAWAGERWTGPAQVAAGLSGVAGVVYAVGAGVFAVIGPLTWLSTPWQGSLAAGARDAIGGAHPTTTWHTGWPAVLALVVLATALAIGARALAAWDAWVVPVCAATMVVAICLAPVVGGASVGVAWVTTATVAVVCIVGAAALDAWRQRSYGLPIALVPLVAATGWSATTRVASISALAALVVTSVAALLIARGDAARAALAVAAGASAATLAGVVTRAAGASAPQAGFALGAAGLLVLLVGATLLSDDIAGLALEWTGGAVAVVGAVIASPSPAWLAGVLTVGVPLLAAAAVLNRDRARLDATLAGAAAVAATWAWLAAAHVGIVEAYTAPAAAFALALGIVHWQRGPARSWIALGPAIVLALGPTLTIGIAEADAPREIVVALLAAAIVLGGAWKRLQAPLVLGSSALLALGVDLLGPAVASLPRWIPPAVVGLLLMWVGATFETRRDRARHVTRQMMRLG